MIKQINKQINKIIKSIKYIKKNIIEKKKQKKEIKVLFLCVILLNCYVFCVYNTKNEKQHEIIKVIRKDNLKADESGRLRSPPSACCVGSNIIFLPLPK